MRERCRYDRLSDEAYSIDLADGEPTPITLHLCEWPDQHPERFAGAPRWLLRLIGPGLAIRPETDCVGCPGYAVASAEARPCS